MESVSVVLLNLISDTSRLEIHILFCAFREATGEKRKWKKLKALGKRDGDKGEIKRLIKRKDKKKMTTVWEKKKKTQYN